MSYTHTLPHKITKFLFIAALLGVTQSVSAQSIYETVKQAEKHNIALKTAISRINAARIQVELANNGWNPNVSASVSGNYTSNSSKTSLGATSSYDQLGASAGLSVSQLIYDGDKTNQRVIQAQAGLASANFLAQNARQVAILVGLQAHADVVRAREVIKLYNLWIKQQQRLVDDSKMLLSLGQGNKLQEAQALAELERVKALLAQSKASLAQANSDYYRYTGQKAKSLENPAKRMNSLAIPANPEEATRIARNNNYLIKASLADLNAAKSALEISRGEQAPTVSANASSSWSNNPTRDVSQTWNHQIQLSLAIPIYSGGSITSGIKLARANLQATASKLNDDTDAQTTATIAAWHNLKASRAQLKSSVARISASTVSEDSIRKSYQAGQRSFSDLLLEIRRKQEALLAKIEAERNVLLGTANLLALLGKLKVDDFNS